MIVQSSEFQPHPILHFGPPPILHFSDRKRCGQFHLLNRLTPYNSVVSGGIVSFNTPSYATAFHSTGPRNGPWGTFALILELISSFLLELLKCWTRSSRPADSPILFADLITSTVDGSLIAYSHLTSSYRPQPRISRSNNFLALFSSHTGLSRPFCITTLDISGRSFGYVQNTVGTRCFVQLDWLCYCEMFLFCHQGNLTFDRFGRTTL